MNNKDFDKRFGIHPYEYIEPKALVLGSVPSSILGSIPDPLFSTNESEKNDEKIALKLEFKSGNLVLVDNLISHQVLKLRRTRKWLVILQPLLKATNNNPTVFRTISRDLLRNNYVRKDNQKGLNDLDLSLSQLVKFWKSFQTNVLENEILSLFRINTSEELKFKFRSAVTFKELKELPNEDYRKLVKILKKRSDYYLPPLLT